MPEPTKGAHGPLLVVEPELGGHQFDHVAYLLRHWPLEALARTRFLVHPDFLSAHGHELADLVGFDAEHFRAATSDDLSRWHEPRAALRSFGRWAVARRHAEAVGARHVHFQHLDHLQLPLALRRIAGVGVSGVLFQPTVHYGRIGPSPSATETLKSVRKAILYRLMLRNSALGTVFTLDPLFIKHARGWQGASKLVYLPDPAPQLADASDARPEPGRADRVRFLLFGALARRKGIHQTARALRHVAPDLADKVAVVFAGALAGEDRADFMRAVDIARAERPSLDIRVDDRRLPEAELERLIAGSDVILMPYQRFAGSSGVLLWAAAAGKPVLAQDYGLVGELVRAHRLGWAVDTTRPEEIGRAMERIVSGWPENGSTGEGAADFLSGRTTRSFACTLFQRLAPALGLPPDLECRTEDPKPEGRPADPGAIR